MSITHFWKFFYVCIIYNISFKSFLPQLSVFGGSGWTWNDDRKQFYFHQFNTKQPEFNIRNLDVQNELYVCIKFYKNDNL